MFKQKPQHTDTRASKLSARSSIPFRHGRCTAEALTGDESLAELPIPRDDVPGPHYGHPYLYIEPRGIDAEGLPRSWAVCRDDGGAWDRHTVAAYCETEALAEAFARLLLRSEVTLHAVGERIDTQADLDAYRARGASGPHKKGHVTETEDY